MLVRQKIRQSSNFKSTAYMQYEGVVKIYSLLWVNQKSLILVFQECEFLNEERIKLISYKSKNLFCFDLVDNVQDSWHWNTLISLAVRLARIITVGVICTAYCDTFLISTNWSRCTITVGLALNVKALIGLTDSQGTAMCIGDTINLFTVVGNTFLVTILLVTVRVWCAINFVTLVGFVVTKFFCFWTVVFVTGITCKKKSYLSTVLLS